MLLLCVDYPKGAISQWPCYGRFSHLRSELPLRAFVRDLDSVDLFVKEDTLNWTSGLNEVCELER